jgi:hypothetical protein
MENGENFFSSTGEEMKNGENFLCKGFIAKPFSILHKGVSHFLHHGEAILLTPLFPHSSFSILRGGVTTPNELSCKLRSLNTTDRVSSSTSISKINIAN